MRYNRRNVGFLPIPSPAAESYTLFIGEYSAVINKPEVIQVRPERSKCGILLEAGSALAKKTPLRFIFSCKNVTFINFTIEFRNKRELLKIKSIFVLKRRIFFKNCQW